MNIIFAGYNSCIRNVKMGLALMRKGVNITWLTYRVANPMLQNILPAISFYGGTIEQFQSKLKLFNNADLIHVHNEPSWLGWAAKEACPNTPVVFDAHDLYAIRTGAHHDDEIKSIHECDAIIFPSRGYFDVCSNEKKHVFPSLGSKPTDVVYSMCTEYFISMVKPLSRIPGIVYEGGISIDVEYRDYRPVAQELTDMKVPFFVYGSTMRYISEYHNAGAICMPTLPYMDLINNLSRFDWGFCGSPVISPQWDTAMPNKVFEYMAAGIPIIAYQANEVAEFVEREGVGIAIKDLQEIQKLYDQHETFRKVVQQKRNEFLMENEVEKVLKIYKALGVKCDREEDQSSLEVRDEAEQPC